MKKRTKLIMRVAAAIVTVASILIFAPWEFAIYYFSPLPATVQEQADEAVEQRLAGIIVYAQKGGQKAEFYASGWHNRDKKIPADPKALFKIASIAKLYNASAVAKLVASGSLSLDGTLADYLPSLVGRIEYADQITLRMMVQHRSGIPNYIDHDDFNWSAPSLDVLEMVLDTPADFKPDSDYGYSNTNYLLLGRIMDKTLGYDHTRYIQDEILAPLGLKRTFFSVKDINLDDLMSGYYVGYPDDFKELDHGYIATAEDVGIFLRALNDGTLFTDKEQEIYTSIYKYEHSGWVLGYSSIARYHSDIDTVVILFGNTNGDDTIMLTEIVYDRILQILRKRRSNQ
jgi:D-alanyl-D-alanine carboxypeptidase